MEIFFSSQMSHTNLIYYNESILFCKDCIEHAQVLRTVSVDNFNSKCDKQKSVDYLKRLENTGRISSIAVNFELVSI